ncbi:hypothetical protein HY498_00055 [Candidatus Woesearchaeota archaeon]|nr:hypothetical protein [Candidatus Woesearchaeota archaeon]
MFNKKGESFSLEKKTSEKKINYLFIGFLIVALAAVLVGSKSYTGMYT